MPDSVDYRVGDRLDVDTAIDLYRASTLGERRPIHDREQIARMLAGANLLVSAWEGKELVGIARSLTDWAYATYLSDLAVRASHQRGGIGTELVARTRDAAPRAAVILLAAPASVEYYPKIGFERHPAAFFLPPPGMLPAPPST